MLRLKPYSASMLALSGSLLIVMGIYFVVLRPSLLLEDLYYMKTSLSVINNSVPGLSAWLQKVFWVMGGYIFSTGLRTVYISRTSFLTRSKRSFIIVAITGISSIGSMTVVNFILGSDFKWLLLAFTILWVIALILYQLKK